MKKAKAQAVQHRRATAEGPCWAGLRPPCSRFTLRGRIWIHKLSIYLNTEIREERILTL